MRHIKLNVLKTTLLCVSGLGLFATSAPTAFAGGCGVGVNPALCKTGVNVHAGTGPVFDNMNVHVQQPMGHLRTIDYQRAPNVSITRVHGMADSASITDFPSSFSNGCHPSSTAYCRQDSGVPVNVEFNAPQAQAVPTYNFAPALPAPRIVATGGGYDPSKFIPRQYGEFTFTPGTAYIPTSNVNRNPADAARVLAENGYSTSGFQTVNLPSSSMNFSAPVASSNINLAAAAAPVTQFAGANVLAGGPAPILGAHTGRAPQGAQYLGSVVTGQTTTGSSAPSGNVIGGVDGSGGYWEKVSGLTMFGDTVATSVVCRRQAPQTTAQVVSPVYGIPQPVPTPVPYWVDVPYKVQGNVIPQGCRPVGNGVFNGPVHAPRPGPFTRPFPAATPGVLPYGPTMGAPRLNGPVGVAPTVGQMGGLSSQAMTAGWTY